MGFLQETTIQLLNPLVHLWNGFAIVLPGLVAALVILVIGYFFALIVGYVVKVLLAKAQVEKALKKIDLPKSLANLNVPKSTAEIVKWFVFIIFLEAAADVLNLGALSNVLNRLVLWLPSLLIAIIAVFFGLLLGHYVCYLVQRDSKIVGIVFVGNVFKWIIIFLSFLIALEQIGVSVDILENIFLVLLAAVAFGVALAFGLAFGLGLKDQSLKAFEELKKKMK